MAQESQSPKLGHVVPNFRADTTQGPIDWHQWIEGSWAMYVCQWKLLACISLACTIQLR